MTCPQTSTHQKNESPLHQNHPLLMHTPKHGFGNFTVLPDAMSAAVFYKAKRVITAAV